MVVEARVILFLDKVNVTSVFLQFIAVELLKETKH